jgi:hypothetical protein
MRLAFGRLPHDQEAVAAAPKHVFGVALPPLVVDRSQIAFKPGLYRNDTLPDCTAVALANGARAVGYLNGFAVTVYDMAVPHFYSACIGNPPNLAETEGANMLDVLRFQASHGYVLATQELVGVFGVVPLERLSLAHSIARLGFGYWGLTLFQTDMEQFENRVPWTLTPDRGAHIGGHAVLGWDYTGLGDNDTVRIGTWGGFQAASWAWLEDRLDEAYGVVWRQLARTDGKFYDGLTADGLIAEL